MPRKSAASTSTFQVPAAARKQLSQFIRKLVELIETSPDDIIRWTRQGTAFVVADPKRLSKQCLGTYFRSTQFNSFVRQLNFYAMCKVAHSKFNWEFTHPRLRRGDWASLALIKRKTSNEFHASHDKELKEMRETVSGLKRQLADALAMVSSLEAQRDAAVSRSVLLYEAALAAGVQLDEKLTAPPAVHTIPAATTPRSRPRKRRRQQKKQQGRQRRQRSTPAPVATPPSSSPSIHAAASPVSPTIAPLTNIAASPSRKEQQQQEGAAGAPVPHHDMFLLPGDPSGLISSSLLDDDDDVDVITMTNMPVNGGSSSTSKVKREMDVGLLAGSTASETVDVGNDLWLDFATAISMPPALTRGFSGMSMESAGSLDVFNAFAQSTCSKPDCAGLCDTHVAATA